FVADRDQQRQLALDGQKIINRESSLLHVCLLRFYFLVFAVDGGGRWRRSNSVRPMSMACLSTMLAVVGSAATSAATRSITSGLTRRPSCLPRAMLRSSLPGPVMATRLPLGYHVCQRSRRHVWSRWYHAVLYA